MRRWAFSIAIALLTGGCVNEEEQDLQGNRIVRLTVDGQSVGGHHAVTVCCREQGAALQVGIEIGPGVHAFSGSRDHHIGVFVRDEVPAGALSYSLRFGIAPGPFEYLRLESGPRVEITDADRTLLSVFVNDSLVPDPDDNDCDATLSRASFRLGAVVWTTLPGEAPVDLGERIDSFEIVNDCRVVFDHCPPVPDPGQGATLSDQPDISFGKKLLVDGEDNYQLFGVNPDGMNLRRATDNTYRDRSPVWLRGQDLKLAFTSNRLGIGEDSYEAFLADETTSNLRLITHETCRPQVAQVAATRKVTDIASSPDGTKLAYSAGGDILVIGIAPGSAAVELTQGPEDDRGPTWSQDGARIAFLRGMELWVMDADGSDQEFLLDQVLVAAWSPVPAAGRRIAVVRVAEGLSTLEDDGSLVPFGDGTAPLNGLALAWSPDGDAIAIHEETETIWIVRETGTTAISVGVPGDRIEGLTWRAPPP